MVGGQRPDWLDRYWEIRDARRTVPGQAARHMSHTGG
jgi:hypothetical protein